MTIPNIEKLSVAQLEALIEEAKGRIQTLKQQDEAIEKAKAILREAHVDLEALLENKSRPPAPSRGRRAGTTPIMGDGKHDAVNARYFNPETGDWHSGLGRKPAWLKDDPDAFEITSDQREELIRSGQLKNKPG